jgi:hypothetical protein
MQPVQSFKRCRIAALRQADGIRFGQLAGFDSSRSGHGPVWDASVYWDASHAPEVVPAFDWMSRAHMSFAQPSGTRRESHRRRFPNWLCAGTGLLIVSGIVPCVYCLAMVSLEGFSPAGANFGKAKPQRPLKIAAGKA